MRIIAGKYKGRSLLTLPDRTVRPTTDRVKEAIFNLVWREIEGAEVLDLFAGSGALGIECLSRGAKEVLFNDASRRSLEAVKANLMKLGEDCPYRMTNRDWKVALAEAEREGKTFDLIFLDPPYEMGRDGEILKEIASRNLLKQEGTIIFERARESAEHPLPRGYAITDARDYGATTVELIRRARVGAVTGVFDPITLGHVDLVEAGLERYDYVYLAILVNPAKTPTFSLKKRTEWAKKALEPYKGRARVVSSDLWAYECLNFYGVEEIVRGVRNETDRVYEEEMAAFHREKGLETRLIEAKRLISSTEVREKIRRGESLEGFVPKKIIKDLKKEGAKWTI